MTDAVFVECSTRAAARYIYTPREIHRMTACRLSSVWALSPSVSAHCPDFTGSYFLHDADGASSWHPGLAVRIHTKDSDEGRDSIPVTFVFANGERIQQTTDGIGYAAIPRDDPSALRAVALPRPNSDRPDGEIALDPSQGRVFYIQIDTDVMDEIPPFDHLVLQIKGSDLVSEKIGGTYSRE